MPCLAVQLDKVTDIHQRLAAVREENRLLYNTVQDLRGNIRVFCRVRPQGATGDASQIVVDVSGTPAVPTVEPSSFMKVAAAEGRCPM